MWKEEVVAYSRHCSRIFMERLKKTMRNNKGGRWLGQDLKGEPSKYKTGLLIIAV
jgi:hypothetical protein